MKAITISLVAHLTLITLLTLASILAPGLLPNPRSVMLAFHDTARMVRMVDIELPAVKSTPGTPRAGGAPSPLTTNRVADIAPVIAPGLAPGPGPEPGDPSGYDSLHTVEGVSGMVPVAGIGSIEAPAPPVNNLPIRLHAGIDAPRRVIDAMPAYPALARTSRVSGIVILEATIDVHGDVTATRILRSIPLLDQAATDAVRSWKYAPARLNGEAVAVLLTVTVNFTLRD
jgi:TonB family protein